MCSHMLFAPGRHVSSSQVYSYILGSLELFYSGHWAVKAQLYARFLSALLL